MLLKTQGTVKFGEFELNAAERTLTRAGAPVAISPKAFDLLTLLVEQPGKLRTKQELLDAIWPDTAIGEATLGRHISDLRRVLGSDQPYIETVTRHGYRFLAEAQPTPTVETPPAPPTKPTHGLKWLAVLATCSLAFAGFRLLPRRSAPAAIPRETNLIRLTSNLAADGQPDWSPDGSKVVFVSNRDGLPAIWTMRADGSNPRNLTGSLGRSDSPAWSPDGTRDRVPAKARNAAGDFRDERRRHQSARVGSFRRQGCVVPGQCAPGIRLLGRSAGTDLRGRIGWLEFPDSDAPARFLKRPQLVAGR